MDVSICANACTNTDKAHVNSKLQARFDLCSLFMEFYDFLNRPTGLNKVF